MDGKKTWFSIDFPSNPVIFAKRTSISDRLGVARGYLQVKLYRGIYLAGSGAPRVHPGAPRGVAFASNLCGTGWAFEQGN